jgi:hypothetical protein
MENFYAQEQSNVNGRNVWRYLVVTPIGNINIVQYEKKGKELETFLYEERLGVAERKYKTIIRGILNGSL